MGGPSIVTPSVTLPSLHVLITWSSSSRVSHAASRWEMTVLASSIKAMILLMRSLMELCGVTERWARSACCLLMFLSNLPRTSAMNTPLRGHPWAKPLFCKKGMEEADE
eukprot:5420306-Ditylum_brightwellii.AAC.1